MCAIIGVENCQHASRIVRQGLRSMQHRGQESAGIVVSDGAKLRPQVGMGLVDSIFTEESLDKLPGTRAIGQARYSTSGNSTIKEAQPFLVDNKYGGSLAICHNGNLPFSDDMREVLIRQGALFQSSSDTETILHLIARSGERTFMDALVMALGEIKGAYSLLFMTEHQLIAIKDPHGIRPLCLGRINGSWVVASESCAFNLIDAEYVRELAPGEMLIFESGKEPASSFPLKRARRPSQCVFEKVYLARPDSFVYGDSANKAKHKMGRRLAEEHPVAADMVVPVPDSGSAAAVGFAKASGIPLMLALVRDHYSDRTFINPDSKKRFSKVLQKLSPIADLLQGHSVILVDDSIVRGNTSRAIVKMVRDAGATEVHLRISSPPTIHPCFYGMDTPTEDELIAAHRNLGEIQAYMNCDSLGYLSLKGMLAACEDAEDERHCHACFSGTYPIEVRGGVSKFEREQLR